MSSPTPPYQQPHTAGAPNAAAAGNELGDNLKASFQWGWIAFKQSPLAFIVPGAVYGAIAFTIMIFTFIIQAILLGSASGADSDGSLGAGAVIVFLVALPLIFLAYTALYTAWISGAYNVASIEREGRRAPLAAGFIGPGRVIVTYLLYCVIVFIASLLLILPGIAAAVIFMYAPAAAARGMSPIDALKESWGITFANPVPTIVLALVIFGIGMLLGGSLIGSLVAPAVGAVLTMGMMARLRGEQLPGPATS